MRGTSVPEPGAMRCPEGVCCQRQMVVVEVAGGGSMIIAGDPGHPSKLVGHCLVGHLAVLLKV